MSVTEKIYRHFYQKRKRRAEGQRIAFPEVVVFSVGNITTGGTGKTPAVQWLTRFLQNEQQSVVVVGRGYGGEYSGRGGVVSDGQSLLLNAAQAGDEAVLHGRALSGVPVVIGRDRVAAVRCALETFAPHAVVLDDGFQYWSLERDFDLVLLDARCPFGNGKLLPTGRLREPQTALRRAQGVLLTRSNRANETERQSTRAQVAQLTSAPVYWASHCPTALRDEASGALHTLDNFAGQRVAALSALADNDNFFHSLQGLDMQCVSTLPRRDHHRWREAEVKNFARQAKKSGAVAAITTEKDAVKIPAAWLEGLPYYSVVIEMHIANEAALQAQIRAVLKQKKLVS